MKNPLGRSLIVLIICFVITSLGIISCTKNVENKSVSTSDQKPVVAVSIVPQETFVKAVADDLVNTVVLIPPGNSPTNYAPSPQELVHFSNASLYFSIGVPTEEANILPKLSDINKNLKVVNLATHVAQVYPDREIAPNKRDPHIWLSPKRVKVMVKTIAQELAKLDPQNKDTYQKNADKYLTKLNELDQKIKTSLLQLQKKTFIVYHPAFGYFANDYQLTMVAIEEGGKEATIESIQKIIDLAKKEHIKAIFHQGEIDSGQSRAIAQEIGAKIEMVAPLAPNYIENLEKIAKTFAKVLQ